MNNKVHPTAIIGKNVSLGSNNIIGAYAVIEGHVNLGDNNHIFPHVVIGCSAQMHHLDASKTNLSGMTIDIGSFNYIREFVTVHSPSYDKTFIGDYNILMAYSHVSHDTFIYNNVKITNAVQIGGFSIIESRSYLGLSATIQQRTVIGYGSMVGMGTPVSRSIAPFTTFAGSPMEYKGLNLRGIRRHNLDSSLIKEIKLLYSESGTLTVEKLVDNDEWKFKDIFLNFEKSKSIVLRS